MIQDLQSFFCLFRPGGGHENAVGLIFSTANPPAELMELGVHAFALSPVHQVLIEKSVKGYKEIEFEVMRDSEDRAITICGMENVDPRRRPHG